MCVCVCKGWGYICLCELFLVVVKEKFNNIYTIKQEIAIPRDKLVHDEMKQRMQEKLSQHS